jgi:hypothetical protein
MPRPPLAGAAHFPLTTRPLPCAFPRRQLEYHLVEIPEAGQTFEGVPCAPRVALIGPQIIAALEAEDAAAAARG